MQISCLYVSDFPFKIKTFTNSLNMQKQYEKNVSETSDDTYSLSVRVQTTINHISICFLPQYQRQRKCFSSERELESHSAIALCDSYASFVLSNLPRAPQLNSTRYGVYHLLSSINFVIVFYLVTSSPLYFCIFKCL